LGLVSVAAAQTVTGADVLEGSGASSPPKTFAPPQEDALEQLRRGVTGSLPTRVWFVIAGTAPTLQDAQESARIMAAQVPQALLLDDLRAEVYEPSGGFRYYAVVLGANLTLSQAEALRERAVAAGWPSDTYLWRLAS
jgi:hypothetical protein